MCVWWVFPSAAECALLVLMAWQKSVWIFGTMAHLHSVMIIVAIYYSSHLLLLLGG
jgi:hypothetical protein